MIRYYKREGKLLTEVLDAEEASWINISAPFVTEELTKLSESRSIPLDYLTASLDIDERSRYEVEDDVKLIVLNTPLLNQDEDSTKPIYITAPIGIILTPDHIVTISLLDNPILSSFIENRIKNFKPSDEKMFVLQIFEQNVYAFLDCLKKLNLRRDLIEQELYNSSRNSELRQLHRIEKSLVYFVTSLSSNELLKLKIKRSDFLRIREFEAHTDLFEDIIVDNSQALEMANVHTNILSSTTEVFASVVSNNLNEFIQRLTLITIILMVPTLVASFYGMNVNLPFMESEYAFYFIIFFSVILIVFLVWFFRRKKLI
jgi:magnesium transporter